MRRLFDPKRILLLAIGMVAFSGGAQAPLWSCHFTNAGWLAGWDNTNDVPKKGIAFGGTNITRIVDASAPGGAFLRLAYPAGSYVPSGSPPAPIGGAQFYGAVLHINGNTPLNALTLQYSLRFPTNFNFVKGGKLPGLYGGAGNTGSGAGTVPDGTDGFTTRFMWRTNGQGEAYPYLPTSPSSGGTELGKGNWHFAGDNQWHTLRQTCVLNDVGISNGVIQAWYDGVLVLNTNGLYFRSTNSLQIDGVVFQTFLAAATRPGPRRWTPTRTSRISRSQIRIKPILLHSWRSGSWEPMSSWAGQPVRPVLC
jgi:hypothetical protein